MLHNYNMYKDPGHGWLEVPFHELVTLEIYDEISNYSFVKGTKVFLEEDCDASLFIRAWEKKTGLTWGPERMTIFRTDQGDSVIRKYPRYQWIQA